MQIPDSVKTFAVRSLPYLATAVVGVGIGWGIKPDQVRVEEKVRVETVEKQVVVTHETVRVEVVKVKDSQVVERFHREKTETKSPDGTIVKKETEDRNVDTIVKEKENTSTGSRGREEGLRGPGSHPREGHHSYFGQLARKRPGWGSCATSSTEPVHGPCVGCRGREKGCGAFLGWFVDDRQPKRRIPRRS
jgi:hypothetical protein